MNLQTEIGDRREFKLTNAVLLYEEQVFKRECFATVHPVFQQEADGESRLGPGSLLTTAALKLLCRNLEMTKSTLLPPNVLAYSSDSLIWWTPPRLHTMYFSEGDEDRAAIHNRIYPHPSLVWRVHRGVLYLRAMAESVRPTAETPLMVAPYWNTAPTSGGVCPGDMPQPEETDVTTMLRWEEAFFNSRFTHPSGMGSLTTHAGGFIGLWTELAEAPKFPAQYLAPANESLEQFAMAGEDR